MENKIAIFKDAETILEVPVSTEEKTVWLNRQQMSVLFDRDVKTIGKHINNAMREELEGQVVVAKFATPPGTVLWKVKRKPNKQNITISM